MEKKDSTTSVPGRIIQIDEAGVLDHPGEIVRGSVEVTLNTGLQKEADELCQAQRYERKAERVSNRAGRWCPESCALCLEGRVRWEGAVPVLEAVLGKARRMESQREPEKTEPRTLLGGDEAGNGGYRQTWVYGPARPQAPQQTRTYNLTRFRLSCG